MKVRNTHLKLRILSLAMMGVCSSMYAYADEEEAAALMNPTSTVEVEGISVSINSQKFGEYNGLNKQGVVPNGNLNIRGGDAYKNNANGGTQRWVIQGTDLGLSDRSANIGYSDQGNWGVNVGYDELTHNVSSGYQTPYQGSMGGNSFTLPSNFTGKASGSGASATGSPADTNKLGTAQLNQFQNENISTTRKNSSFNAIKIIDSNTNVTFDFNHLDQTGAKLMGFASAGLTGTPTASSGEKTSILPNPTNYQTDTVTAAINWQGEKARLTGSYFGSFFRDGYNGVNFQTFATPNPIQTMSTAPSNQLQQLNLGGGYDFSNLTKLAGNFSIGRNTQNSSTAYDPYMMTGAFPTAAFNGLVNTTHFDLKLTDKTVKDLALLAGYKFDQRNNLSQSSLYSFNQINATTNGSSAPYSPSTPLSFQNSQFDLGGEYKITKNQKASLNLTNLQTTRWCNQYATGTYQLTNGAAPTTGPNIPYTYPAGADCVTANASRTNTINAGYKIKASESVDVKLNYIYDVRRTTTNQNAITGMDVSASGNINVNNAYGLPIGVRTMYPGQNGGDYVGYQPFFEASRNQQAVKARTSWQASDDLSFGLNGKYTYASYPDSTYGVQNSTAWNISLDSAYKYAEEGTVTAYAVQQNSQRNLTSYMYSASGIYPPPATANTAITSGTWNNNLQNHDTTFGLSLKHTGLMSGKVDLNSDLTYSLGQTYYNTSPGSYSYVGTGTNANGASSAYYNGSFGSPPAIRNDLLGIRIGGIYKIDKHSKVGLQYLYQRLLSTDYYYNGLQYGTTPTSVMPTNQNSGSYNVNVITLGYSYSFD